MQLSLSEEELGDSGEEEEYLVESVEEMSRVAALTRRRRNRGRNHCRMMEYPQLSCCSGKEEEELNRSLPRRRTYMGADDNEEALPRCSQGGWHTWELMIRRRYHSVWLSLDEGVTV